MADNQVISMVNRNHELRLFLGELDFNLDICILEHNLHAISARRRNRNVSKVSLLWRKFRSL